MINCGDVIAARRELHKYPETAFLELGTSALVRACLMQHGWTIHDGPDVIDLDSIVDGPGEEQLAVAAEEAISAGRDRELVRLARERGTGLIARLEGARPGKHTALRFDMDALPIDESTSPVHVPTREGFGSRYRGRMHACGHDGHVAVGLALAKSLSNRQFPGTVSLIFQPGEEGVRGAAAMLAADSLEEVDRMVGLHLGNSMPVGQVAGSAVDLLATSKLQITIEGRGAHAGSAPEQGRNALLAAATATLNLQSLPRFAGDLTRVNVGTMSAGRALNVVPSHAELGVELRAGKGKTLRELVRRVSIVVEAAAAMHECRARLSQLGASTSLEPDPQLVEEVVRAAEATGAQDVAKTWALGASDDFSLFAQAVQSRGGEAAFVLIGGGNRAPHHHSEFDIDERCLPQSVSVLERLIRDV